MGITGVNFAAAASGHLVLLENEGNLRLTATAPPVHVALMGMEKIIPTLADLEVFLRLLPVSATGQRLTAYVNIIRALKPQARGNQAFYLIILDNGRRRLAADPVFREALFCLRCGACLNICPIFQLGGGHLYGRVYPGAIGILLAPYLGSPVDLTDLCTQCGACSQICPAGIALAQISAACAPKAACIPGCEPAPRPPAWCCTSPALSPPAPRSRASCGGTLATKSSARWWGDRRPALPAPQSFFESLPPERRARCQRQKNVL